MRPFPGEIKRGKFGKIWLNDAQEKWFMETFPVTENRRVAKAMGVSEQTVHRIAREYGLKKSAEGLHAIMVRNGKRVSRKLEARGFYASLRGRKPSEAVLEGYRRYVNGGNYKHPFAIMKERSPRKYKRLMREKGERHRDLWRQEKRRMELGLRRKTTLHIPANNYTTSQSNHRYNAMRRGYIVPDKMDYENRWCIWYDDETERARIFERNLKGDGFKVMPLPGDEDEHLNQYRFN